MFIKKFPFYKQLDRTDCGPTCLQMIAKYYGKTISLEYLREKSYITRDGISVLGLTEAAENIGFRSLVIKIDLESLDKVPLPCILHWRQRHFIVIYKISKKYLYAADPDFGLIAYTRDELKKGWIGDISSNSDEKGLAVLLEPTPPFYQKKDEKNNQLESGFSFLRPYFKPYKNYIFQIVIGLLVGSFIQLAFPFVTQSIVDYGIKNQNIGFIYLLLMAQVMLSISQTGIEMIRGWLLLHIGSRINISLISDYLAKLMRMPVKYFDTRRAGDIMKRIEDNERIETFLSSTSLMATFSLFNLALFGSILLYYNYKIFLIFFIGAFLYMGWVVVFMKQRYLLDFKRFDETAGSTNNLIQLINGIQEIKLNNSEKRHRWEWESIQARLFNLSVKGLTLSQYQITGSTFINEIKNVFISFTAAQLVIKGELTLGMMLAVQYIIGQLNSPLNSFIGIVQRMQDAKLSLERIAEIHNSEDETSFESDNIKIILPNQSITIKNNLNFKYGGKDSAIILRDLNFSIPHGKVTAIVGASGSGKTTLLKLLAKLYPPSSGTILVGSQDINHIDTLSWRSKCGIVMQDGFIFSDTIARNITESDSSGIIDKNKLLNAVRIANLEETIESFPTGYNTKIGGSGIQLSGGQKQRVLIARAIYKDPEFLFFDEATSALDAKNEKIIVENLKDFYLGRTVLVIAHRLSTVRDAHNIVMMDKGTIVEQGTHKELVDNKGAYFELVKNQLELGN
jgi:ATP-binding cassette, subfamily B, bacterial